jgi:hypothetical protein
MEGVPGAGPTALVARGTVATCPGNGSGVDRRNTSASKKHW